MKRCANIIHRIVITIDPIFIKQRIEQYINVQKDNVFHLMQCQGPQLQADRRGHF